MRQQTDEAELSREISGLLDEIARNDGCMDIARSLDKLFRFHGNDPRRQHDLTMILVNEASARGWPVQLSGRDARQCQAPNGAS